MSLDLLIKNAKVFTHAGPFEGDIGVKDGKIVKIAGDIQEQADKVVNTTGKYIVPGLIDGHTHMEFPFMGEITADDFYYGTRAAVAGGVTTIVDFVTPAVGQDLLSAYEQWRNNADPKVISDYSLHMIVRNVNNTILEQIPEVIKRGVISFKLFMAYKDLMLRDSELYQLIKKITENGGVIGIHAENGEIINELVNEFLIQGKVEPIYHYFSRPDVLEIEATNRIATIASMVGKDVKMYIVHTSTGEAVDIISSYRKQGYKFYNETTPHYLTLTTEYLKRPDGYRYVMSPPLRSDEQRTKLWMRLVSGDIFTIGSDHCVYTDAQKKRYRDKVPPFHEIPNGVPGTENILPILFYFGVKKGVISMERFVEVTSYNPARLFGLYPKKGVIMPGADADFAVIDPNMRIKVTADVLHSNINYTIYEGMEVEGWNVMTIRRGDIVYENGQVVGEKGSGKYIPGKTPVMI
ncbi:dihydropyrimidinase [Sulfolobaceae archaeon RB850M]